MKRKLFALILALLLCQGLLCPALAVVEEIAAVKVDDITGYSRSDGVYTVVQDGLYGFYRADGAVLAEPSYAYAEDFRDGMAVVSPAGTGRYGYLDLDGRMAVAAQYRRAYPFSQERAFAVSGGSGVLVLLDREGRELASFPDAELRLCDGLQFSEGLAVIPVRAQPAVTEEEGAEVSEAGTEETALVYRVVDQTGREVCTLTDAYADVRGGYHDGCIAVAAVGEWTDGDFRAEAGAWGYRDAAGELVIGYRYDEAAPFSEGVAGVGLRDDRGRILYGFIDPAGGEVVPAAYDGFVSCENGVGALLRSGAWGYVAPTGRMRTGFRFNGASPFSEGVAWVRSGGRRSVVNEAGTVLFSTAAEDVLPCSGGVIPVQGENGLWGIYDKSGNLLVGFTYERALHWDGYLWLKRGDLWRVYLTEDVVADRAAAAAAADAGAETEPVAAVGTFSDVAPDSYYAQAVTWATDSDIMTGTGGGQFSPERSCTKGEIVACLWRAAGRPEPQIGNPFADVSPSHYYYQAALWACENGITAGETFGAAEPCTRALAVTYLWSMDGRPYALPADIFDDVPAEAAWAQAVTWAVTRGITEGNDSGLFEPDSICSRGQIVTFLYRYLVD